MRYAIVYSALVVSASAHGLVTSIEGANGVSMPGLSVTPKKRLLRCVSPANLNIQVANGTPRDCSSNRCGSQADTSIIRDREMNSGRASALGRTQGNGPVDAAAAISSFMDGGNQMPTNNGTFGSVGVEDDIRGLGGGRGAAQRRDEHQVYVRGLLDNLLGGLTGGGNSAGSKNNFAAETMVGDMAGQGAAKGLPTADENGMVTMVFRQINQDGAGPLTADIDGTSGGKDPSAFQSAQVMQNVPGLPFGGLSLATNTDFPIQVQMPQGMTCDAQVGGANNVCVVRVRNRTPVGPFGGSAAFTQTPAARKRAIAFRLKKRFELSRAEDTAALAKADAEELAEEEAE